MLTVAIESTPAAIQQAGVGRYCRELLRALVQETADERYKIVSAANDEANQRLLAALPPGAWREVARLPGNARLMTAFWQRLRAPLPVDLLAGNFDVFHGTDFVLPPTRRPSVVTIHDLSFLLHPEYAHPDLVAYLRSAVPRALRHADAVITVSASVAADVASAYPFARERIVAIPNGVRFPDEAAPDRAKHDRPVILTVGTVEPRKGHVALLDAMDEVWERYPDAQFIVAGRVGWKADQIAKRLSRMEADGKLVWRRHTSDDELETLYSNATVFVYPTRYEGFGLPVLEAMARGVPVVASDVPAIREAAGDYVLLAPPGRADALAGSIVRLLDDDGLRKLLGAAGMERARRRTWHETARRTRRVYHAIAGEGRH